MAEEDMCEAKLPPQEYPCLVIFSLFPMRNTISRKVGWEKIEVNIFHPEKCLNMAPKKNSKKHVILMIVKT